VESLRSDTGEGETKVGNLIRNMSQGFLQGSHVAQERHKQIMLAMPPHSSSVKVPRPFPIGSASGAISVDASFALSLIALCLSPPA